MKRFDSTCWSVVLGAASGNAEDREEFGRRYEPVVRSYLCTRWRVRFHDDLVSDGVQEVFLECLRPAGALERLDRSRTDDFRAYLYGITRRTAIGLERRRRRDRRVEAHDSSLCNAVRDTGTLSAAFDRAWAVQLSVEALRLWRSRTATSAGGAAKLRCLELRFHDGAPPRVIAGRLGLSVERVYDLLKQAKEEYRRALLDVAGRYRPDATRRELEEECRALAGDL